MNKQYIESQCKEIRKYILKEAIWAKGGHMGAALSVTDILGTLYFSGVMKYNSADPDWEERDRLILSKGHAALALYATLALSGFFPTEWLKGVCQAGSSLGGHPKFHDIPGVEASTGALGHGLSLGIGMALAMKLDGRNNHTYVILGDGECQEGSVWEGALSAPNLGLGNLTVFIDHNKLQAMDRLENIVDMNPLAEKWEKFGWNVLEINGHNVRDIYEAATTRVADRPTLIVAHTIKGKGISFMEEKPLWHYRLPNEAEMPIALKELGINREELR